MEYTNIQYQSARCILGNERGIGVTILQADEYPRQCQADRLTYTGYLCDHLHWISRVMIQRGNDISNETILFREEWAILSLTGEYRAKLLDVVVVDTPPHNLEIFARRSTYKFVEVTSRM